MREAGQGGLTGLAGRLAACVLVMAFTACGGGGGSSTPPPVVEPAQPDAAAQAAAKAELRAYSTPSANKAELRWTDWIDGETGFRIDKSVNGVWTPVTTLPANLTQPWDMGWAGTLDPTITAYRVVALLPGGKEVALKSPAGLGELRLGPAPAGASIALSMAEPLQGQVKVSITGAPDAQSAGFYIDLRASTLPISAVKPRFETTWDTASEENGSYWIRALLQYAPDTFVNLERTVTLANAELKATVVGFFDSTTPQAGHVYVVPTNHSLALAVSASLSVDGKDLGTRTTRDCYHPANGDCAPAYLFTLNAADYDLGTHTLVARILDAQGHVAEATGSLVKGIPLGLTLSSPTTARFTGPKVQIRGEVTGDPASPVYAAVDFSGRLLQERNSYGPLSAEFDLTGLPDATYFMTVTARGVNGATQAETRFVFWQSSPPMNYQWVRDGVDAILASGRDGLLVRSGDAVEWQRPNAAPVTLGGGIPGTSSFKAAGGQWVGNFYGAESGLYVWGADGQRRTLSTLGIAGFSALGNQAGWVGSVANQPSLVLADLTTLAPVAVPLPGDPARVRGQSVSLGTGAGDTTVAVYDEALLDATGNWNGSVVFAYDAASNQHRPLSDAARAAYSPVTNGSLVAWYAKPSYEVTELWVAPVDGSGVPQRLSTVMLGVPQWTNDLLVWAEAAGFGANFIKVYRNGSVSTLLTQLPAQLMAVGGGAVAYVGGKRLLVWTPDKGERLVHGLFEGAGRGQVALADGWLYFTIGGTLYRVPL